MILYGLVLEEAGYIYIYIYFQRAKEKSLNEFLIGFSGTIMPKKRWYWHKVIFTKFLFGVKYEYEFFSPLNVFITLSLRFMSESLKRVSRSLNFEALLDSHRIKSEEKWISPKKEKRNALKVVVRKESIWTFVYCRVVSCAEDCILCS